MLSRRFIDTLKNTGKPYHKLAWEVGITPSQLYRLTAGIDRPAPGDPRVIKLCAYLGMSISEAFESDVENPQAQSNA